MKKFDEVVEALSFPVSKVENQFTNAKGEVVRGIGCQIVRGDNGKAIANVSDTYGLIPHAASLKPVLAALDGMGFDLKSHYMDHDGRRVMVKALSQQSWSIGKLPNGQTINDHGGLLKGTDLTDDRVKLSLLLSNAYDRTQALKVQVGAFRIICSNGLVVEHPAFKGLNINLKVVHSQNQTKNLDFVKLGNQVAALYAAFEKQAEDWRKMKQTVLNKAALESVKLNVLTPVVGERNVDKVMELVTGGKGQDGTLTLWALYNGVTEHYSAQVEKSKTPVSAHGNLNRKATGFLGLMDKWTAEHPEELVTVNA